VAEYVRLMLTYIRPPLLIALINLLLASPVHAWGSKGHEIVAAIWRGAPYQRRSQTDQRTPPARNDTRRCIDMAR